MSLAVAASHHVQTTSPSSSTTAISGSGIYRAPSSSTSMAQATMDSNNKRSKTADKPGKESPAKETRTTAVPGKSQKTSSSSPKQELSTLDKSDKVKTEPNVANTDAKKDTAATTTTAPLAPPPKPSIQNSKNDSDYFAPSHKNHLSSEPNPFEQSFGNPAAPRTPGKDLLPGVASITSPAPLGTGNASLTGGFGWGGSLRSGPLSPAMLSGPQGDYFDSIRSFPTPNESSLRTGLTPGGGGSMFPAPSPGTQAFLNAFSGGATPSALDFQRAAASASIKTAKPEPTNTSAPSVRTQPAAMNTTSLPHPDNEAANGLFMLAQASAPQSNHPYSNGAATARNNGSISATSNPTQDDASDDNKNNIRKSKRASAGKNSRRKTDDSITKQQPAAKKGKVDNKSSVDRSPDMEDMDSDDMEADLPKDTRKMTDEEKRKNFLERNRVAALKCRQRKKQWLQNLQSKVEIYSSENDALSAQVTALRDEVLNLKTILIAHKDCPIAQQQSTSGGYLQHGVDYGNAHYGNAPYGMSMQPQQAVGMSGGPRRSS